MLTADVFLWRLKMTAGKKPPTGPPLTTPRMASALMFAERLHSSQPRKKTKIPYLAHLLGVASIVYYYGGTETEAIAGLLHDAVEDQGGAATREMIEKLYGSEIADLVSGCSDTDQADKPPWRARKVAHIKRLRKAGESLLLVSLADKLDNARSLLADLRKHGHSVWKRFNVGRDEQLWHFNALIAAFKEALGQLPEGRRRAALKALVNEYARVVREIEIGLFRDSSKR